MTELIELNKPEGLIEQIKSYQSEEREKMMEQEEFYRLVDHHIKMINTIINIEKKWKKINNDDIFNANLQPSKKAKTTTSKKKKIDLDPFPKVELGFVLPFDNDELLFVDPRGKITKITNSKVVEEILFEKPKIYNNYHHICYIKISKKMFKCDKFDNIEQCINLKIPQNSHISVITKSKSVFVNIYNNNGELFFCNKKWIFFEQKILSIKRQNQIINNNQFIQPISHHEINNKQLVEDEKLLQDKQLIEDEQLVENERLVENILTYI